VLYFTREARAVAGIVYEFGDFRLDCGRFELLRKGRSVRLERKPMELLILLVGKDGQLVTRMEIARHLWESEVFVDTEHGINTAVRKIRQVLGDDSEQPRFVQTVTGMGYRFVAPVRKEAVEEIGGVAEEERAATTVPGTVAGGRVEDIVAPDGWGRWRIWVGVGVVALAAVGVAARGGWGKRLLGSGAAVEMNSVAVIPLENLSGDAGQDYFADGMTDELITMLVKDSTLRVTSRTSMMQYKGVHRPLREIAKELGVDGILEGSIERTGGHVHMNIQLIQAPTDTHVWAESYDRDAGDAVSLLGEAAETIARRVNRMVVRPAVVRTVNPAAHDAYLHGRYLWFSGGNEKAGEYFRKATELQPDYAQGWSGLSVYYGAGAIEGIANPVDTLAPQISTAQRALELDALSPEAHLAMCAAIFEARWDWARADAECKRAIELDPEFSEAYHFRAKMLAALNRHPEAIEAQKKALELDPFSRPWALAASYLLARQYDAAFAEGRQRLESSPNDAMLHNVLSTTLHCKGMEKEATEQLEQTLVLQGDKASADAVAMAYRQGGYRAVVLQRIDDLQRRSADQYVSPVDLALQYAEIGRREEALHFLEEGYRQRSPLLLWVQDDPAYDFLHGEERYRAIIKGVGLPPAY
jgi:TolB-like protein/DNA-binding winged helix-turn-helix (wHTH) protein